MLRLEQLQLTQFKNHPDTRYDFTERIVGITGLNGVGKTNLLDAIHALCFTRGYFSRQDQSLVRHGQAGFRLDGRLRRNNESHSIQLILRETGKKEIWLDGDLLPRMADHLGRYPVVMIAPDDAELIQGESRSRRQFLDALLSQLVPTYLPNLVRFNRLLQQRQALLRDLAENGNTTAQLAVLDVLDEQWVATMRMLIPERIRWSAVLNEKVNEHYQRIAGTKENIRLTYQSDLLDVDPLQRIQAQRARDLAAQRNTVGPHRDDLLFHLGEHPFKTEASQGQRKTLLFALKLAERSLLEDELKLPPFLLLDDVFEKLDPTRMQALLSWVANQTRSQVFITDTDPIRLNDQLTNLGTSWQSLTL